VDTVVPSENWNLTAAIYSQSLESQQTQKRDSTDIGQITNIPGGNIAARSEELGRNCEDSPCTLNTDSAASPQARLFDSVLDSCHRDESKPRISLS
jgi:hypothetical protein